MNIQIIELEVAANPKEVAAELARLGQWVSPLKDQTGQIHAFQRDPSSTAIELKQIQSIPGVKRLLGGQSSHPLVDRLANKRLNIAHAQFGQSHLWSALDNSKHEAPLLIAGPCSFESESLVQEVAQIVAEAGGKWLRGGAYKPRTSPYSFQGEGEKALLWAREAADRNRLQLVTEALSESELELVARYSDIIQVGTRNMQNFALLKKVGTARKPVLLKRGLCSTIDEWLLAGEYLLKHGASHVVFCERGLRHYDQNTRNLLDLGAAALMKHHYKLPIIVDPSHAAGRRDLLKPLSVAAAAMGVDGVMVEVHPDPGRAKSDAAQALSPHELRDLSMALGILNSGIDIQAKSETELNTNSNELLSFEDKEGLLTGEQGHLS